MNDQSGTAQLRFLEETAIRLRQNGFTVEPIEDHHLPVCWEKGRLCRVSGKVSVLYRQENMDSIRAQDALQVVIFDRLYGETVLPQPDGGFFKETELRGFVLIVHCEVLLVSKK